MLTILFLLATAHGAAICQDGAYIQQGAAIAPTSAERAECERDHQGLARPARQRELARVHSPAAHHHLLIARRKRAGSAASFVAFAGLSALPLALPLDDMIRDDPVAGTVAISSIALAATSFFTLGHVFAHASHEHAVEARQRYGQAIETQSPQVLPEPRP